MKVNASLFNDHDCLRAVIDACLEGRAGQIVPASAHPSALRLDVGCYSVFGGDPGSEDARFLLEGVSPSRELVYSGSPWGQRIQAVFPDVKDQSMMTFIPGPNCLDMARHHLGGLSPGYEIAELTPSIARNERLTPNGFQVYETHEAFFENGFGFFVAHEGTMAALTTTYTLSQTKAEIAISTDPSFRRKGLATSLASAIVLECSRRGLVPHWSASNPVSQRIARRVGFVENGVCQVFIAPSLRS